MQIPVELAQTLAAVVDAGTLDAAARRLHITPSAVSQRLKTLEEQLGRVVLVRSRPVRATGAGAVVVRMARQMALVERETARELAGGDSGAAVVLPLAVNADSLGTWFLAPLAKVAREHRVVFDLHRDDQDFTASLLETGTVMGAVTSRGKPVAGCRVEPLGVMRYKAVATPGFVARWLPDGPTPEALAVAPLVDYDSRDDLQNGWLQARGIAVTPPRHRVPASHDFARAVQLGLGWGMLLPFQFREGLADGSLVPLGGPDVDVPLYWQQWNLRSPLLQAVADALTAEARRVLTPPAPDA